MYVLYGYYIVPSLIIILSMLVYLVRNPVYALLALIGLFFHTAIFLIMFQSQFLGFIYLIVYLGAIAILFLFVIMLFNLKNLQQSDIRIQDFTF
jgi:NADH:ubiquinone oxidoreductase subunit 6 (subunit J)